MPSSRLKPRPLAAPDTAQTSGSTLPREAYRRTAVTLPEHATNREAVTERPPAPEFDEWSRLQTTWRSLTQEKRAALLRIARELQRLDNSSAAFVAECAQRTRNR